MHLRHKHLAAIAAGLIIATVAIPSRSNAWANPTALNGTEALTQSAAVSSDESRLVFITTIKTSDQPPGSSSITLLDPVSKARRQIALPSGLGVTNAALSPDGKFVAFVALDLKNLHGLNQDLYVMNIDGSHAHTLTQLPALGQSGTAVLISQPVWSSNSKQLLYYRLVVGPENDGKMMLVTLDGSDAPPQTEIKPNNPVTFSLKAVAFGPAVAWSPDEKTLLFSAIPKANATANDPPVLLSMGVNGKNTQPFKQNGDFAAWSPDGKHVAVSPGDSLTITDADGSNPHQVLNLPDSGTANGFVDLVTWSPDSTQLAYSVGFGILSAQATIYVINIDGSGSTLITQSDDKTSIAGLSWALIPSDVWAALPAAAP